MAKNVDVKLVEAEIARLIRAGGEPEVIARRIVELCLGKNGPAPFAPGPHGQFFGVPIFPTK